MDADELGILFNVIPLLSRRRSFVLPSREEIEPAFKLRCLRAAAPFSSLPLSLADDEDELAYLETSAPV